MPIKLGTLGGANLTAGQEQIAYECTDPAVAASYSVCFCNKNDAPVKVRLAIGSGANSGAAGTRFLEYDAIILPHEPLERTGLAISPGYKVFVLSDTSNVDCSIYGFEK